MQQTSPGPIAAFFDVDNTLLHGASIFHLARGARQAGLLRTRDLARFAVKAMSFTRRGEHMPTLETVKRRALEVIAGHSEAQLHSIAVDIVERYTLRKVWPETVALAQAHMAKGHEVWLLTTTPDFLAREIARRLGLTGACGTALEVVDGRYTGAYDGEVLHGAMKAQEATRITGELGADPAECWAYSDSINDLPLLTFVGNPTAVNPDRQLAAHADAAGWPTLRMDPAIIRAAARRVRREARPARPD